MLIRSLTLATLLAFAGPLFAADGDSPLAPELGKSRPLIIVASSSIDPTLVKLKKALDEPANRDGFKQRNMVLYTVVNLMGQREGKDLDAQTTMALIRQLKLGVSAETKVILVGKDGEKKMEHLGPIEPKAIFDAVDQMPMAEKEAAAPTPPPAPDAAPVKGAKTAKPGKPAKPAKPLEQPDD
ncbi:MULTISPECIES: DUF4174 domain-containing protein [unclassified Pseudomonas]|uniref:DUF4174 domain-containing protein n=1 Tax=unclassified Pseudomonas TaxID=196821 RepID=UPI002AC9B626|nr:MULTISPECIES: DUF4174 domain-containing protein [unclassified Pseudomonas]MEB0048550.1 DUF4174 domain-containing protein [Pseudomonas sp. Dout3]MEB0099413.1 DUF4174 domain-containing protein [Pseudomonas sp. DC1.2]WPX57170.1 DUF4174 domain-containing protein [Pseudomonas sp. DC1.2]